MGEVPLGGPPAVGLFRTGPGYVLLALLAGLLLVSVACPRETSRLSPRELTHLTAGQSLIHDFDRRFDDRDRQRLGELGRDESDLLLASTGAPGAQSFAVPSPYSILLAPWVGLAPVRGSAILNAILIALAATLAAHSLGRRLGRAALALVAICLFASVLYRSVFLVTPSVFLAACVAGAFSLALRHEEPASHGMPEVYRPESSAPANAGRGLVVGALLGVVAVHHPLYLLLALPAGLVLGPERRQSARVGLVGGLVLVLLVFGLTSGLWDLSVNGILQGDGLQDLRVSIGATAWNLLYLLIGRNVGLLPYFLPLLALLGLWQGAAGRSSLVVTGVVGTLLFLVVSPFDFFAGPAAVGSATLVPWFVMLWFVPTRPLPRGWIVATLLLAAPGMLPTWLAPSVEPVTEQGVYRHASSRWHRYLPVETTQQALPPGEVMGNRFWIRSLSREARVSGSRWLLEGGGWAVLHLATPTELAAIHLQFGPQAEADLEVQGADLGDMVLLPDGGVGFRLDHPRRKALHPMWFSPEKHFNYVVGFRMPMEEPRAQTLTLTAIAADLERQRP